MSDATQQVGLDARGRWLHSPPISLARRLSLYFVYAALALSLIQGHVHPTGLLIIGGFVVVFHVATRPLTSDFLVRFPSYLVVLRILLVIMCLGLLLPWLPLPPAWLSREEIAFTITSLLITSGWTVMVMIFLFQARQVRLDTIFSGVAAYFLLAITWTELYKVLSYFHPHSFSPPLTGYAIDPAIAHMRALYYSLSTITSVGFGDILPRRAMAQFLSTLEAAAGQLFLAVLIARLVSRHLSEAVTPLAPAPPPPRHRPKAAKFSRRLRRRRRMPR
ncbi:potassium channel family protein [Desulfoferula mesophila]|uniref:Potassium channel domain-containing protein n=1 Tax=Desulfoferula mesophila TaxID=3058419 RepID=A0AAU9ECM3_9BACT|nr:hypothetical protein FAK_07810 [Desulfoferula mesophilus]